MDKEAARRGETAGNAVLRQSPGAAGAAILRGLSGARRRERCGLRAVGSAVAREPRRSRGESGEPCWTVARAGRRRAVRGAAARGGNAREAEGRLSHRQRSRDNPAGRPTGGMTATRPPPSRDNPAAEGCHVTIPPPGSTPPVLAKAQGTAKLTNHQERCRTASGHRQPVERPNRRGCRVALGHRQPVEHSNTDPKDQEDLQVERNEELHGPQGSRGKVVYTFRLLYSYP